MHRRLVRCERYAGLCTLGAPEAKGDTPLGARWPDRWRRAGDPRQLLAPALGESPQLRCVTIGAAVVGVELAVTGQTGGGELHGSVDGLLVDRGVVEVAGVNAVDDVDGQQLRLACHGVGAGEAVAEIHRLRAPAARMRRCAAQVRMCPSTALRRGSPKPIGRVRRPHAAALGAHSHYGKDVPGVIQDSRPPCDVARQRTSPHTSARTAGQ
jgi:hypothetical protein